MCSIKVVQTSFCTKPKPSFKGNSRPAKKQILRLNLKEFQDLTYPFNIPLKVAVNVSGGEQTFPQIMADFSLFVH